MQVTAVTSLYPIHFIYIQYKDAITRMQLQGWQLWQTAKTQKLAEHTKVEEHNDSNETHKGGTRQ